MVRLTPEERDKLNRLAERTHRYPTEVLRLLLAYAEMGEGPDIQWSAEAYHGQTEKGATAAPQ